MAHRAAISPPAAMLALACRLLPPGSRVVVAVSGGPDSQCLLDMLALLRDRLGLAALWAVGIDHQLRPAAVDELAYAARLAAHHAIAFHKIAVTVDASGNVLSAARQARYAALGAKAAELGASHIATGHTLTDQVETVLLHLCRGTGLGGAGGMRSRRGQLVRPLLRLPRQAIVAWLQGRGITWAQDPSNTDPRRARAQLRTHVLPALEQLNPHFAAHIGQFCDAARADEAWLRRRARNLLKRLKDPFNSIDVAGLVALPPLWRRRVLWVWLQRQNIGPQRRGIAAVLRLLPRAGFCPQRGVSAMGLDFFVERGRLWARQPQHRLLRRKQSLAAPAATSICVEVTPGRLPLGPRHALVVTLHEVGPWNAAAFATDGWHGVVSPQSTEVLFDADRLPCALTVRPWASGDRLQPFGSTGTLKVGDLFTNCKVPRALRRAWPVLHCGPQVLWVLGLRRSAYAPVDAATRRIVALKVEGDGLPPQMGFYEANALALTCAGDVA